jgi:transcriptional regulator of acetoin/glycerol metabolism
MLFTKVHEYFETREDRVMCSKLLALLTRNDWNVTQTAIELGVSRITLSRIIRERPVLAKARVAARIKQLKKVS